MVQKDRDGGNGEITCSGIEQAGGICPDGRIPTLLKENYSTWSLFRLMLPGIVRGDGGYDYAAITTTMDIYQVSDQSRPEIFERIIQIIGVLDKERRSRMKSNRGGGDYEGQ